MPRFPELVVEIATDHSSERIVENVAALLSTSKRAPVDQFRAEASRLSHARAPLIALARDWVTIREVDRSLPPPSASDPRFVDLLEDLDVVERWQYAVVNTGMFNTAERLDAMLAAAGSAGWELIGVYDKASNWWQGMEKGFAILRRRVPDGHHPRRWCYTINA